ncbi:MAG: chemotaxis protein CheB [Thermodesulfobacteriota bacterium]|nr:chemotaxis protein CheB [Thermodesulfobacteriota bacterium]
MQEKFNVLIGDVNPVTIGIMTKAAFSIPGVVVTAGVRSSGMLLAKLKHQELDLLIIDLDSEDMGGVAVIDQIRKINSDITILVVSDPETANPELAVKALEKGVHDCIAKPNDAATRSYGEFRLQLVTITGLIRSRKSFQSKRVSVTRKESIPCVDKRIEKKSALPGVIIPSSKPCSGKIKSRITKVKVVVIASSTGGPGALIEILPGFPADFGVPVLLVQHMPSHMTASFAKSLNKKSAVDVVEAMEGEVILPSKVYIAPGGRHMAITIKDGENRRFITLNDDPPENSVRPSADILFRSVADSYNGGVLAVVLTGMGEDGKKGVEAMKIKGCLCFSQSPESCVVYGMPRAVDSAGLSDESISLDCIAARIVSAVQKGELN